MARIRTGKADIASYVLRIYRHTAGRGARPETLAGVVENVHDNQQRAFHGMAELWAALNAGTLGKSRNVRHETPAPRANGDDKQGRRS